MKKQTITKIISRMIVSVFLLCLIFPIPPSNAATSMSSLYSNPNQGGDSTYKFKVSDVVNGGVLTSVIGCTGIVNKVATWMSTMIQSPEQIAKMAENEVNARIQQLKSACATVKAGVTGIAGAIGFVNDAVTSVKITAEKQKFCETSVDAMNRLGLAEQIKQEKATKARDFKEQCFDGIAITLAKNQLTAMARSTMNWVNSGYGGNPFFVQNMQNLTYNIEKNVVETGIDVLLAPKNASPYAADFARSTINSQGIMASSSKFLGGLQSDLSNFISDPRSLYSDASLNKADTTQDVLLRAQQANDAFARDFSLGGWNGWLALTQRENNNPLGYNMLASQYLSDMQTQAVSDQKAEIAQNNGFMSQKQCILWDVYNDDGDLQYNDDGTIMTSTRQFDKNDKCDEEKGWKIVTPGSLIKDKVTNYLNSPDRQLELVKTINDGLNVLFSALIGKLQGGGLTSLSDSAVATNWTDNMNTLTGDTSSTGITYDNNGAYDGFNLTRDLGNTYIHTPTTNLGTWNANTNTATLSADANKVYPKEINIPIGLYPSTAPEVYIVKIDADGKIQYDDTGKKIKELAYPSNPFYTVTTAGKTKLMIDGYNGWEVGDRAFFDGSKWQNWKKGQQSPIANRGVIQLQQDYIVAAKDVLGVLPKIMTSLGELDYCIPGPNPSYKVNSTDAQSAYQDWIATIYVGPRDMTDGEHLTWIIDNETSLSYKKLADIFNDNTNVWKQVRESNSVAFYLNYFNNYAYVGKGQDSADKDDEWKYNNEVPKIQDFTTKYVTNGVLFTNFFEAFNKMMNKIYFNNMTSQYLDTETSIGVDKNPAYIPMALNGLDLTKNILYYNDDVNQKIQDYADGVTQAKTNIAKLQPIRDEVSGIIQAAQKRRDANLVKILNTENAKTVKLADINKDGTVTEAEYKKYYASCLAEEDIQVFDAEGILGKGSKAEENCNDGIDNDLNGLTDAQDPACIGKVKNTTNNTNRNANSLFGVFIGGAKVNTCSKTSPTIVTPPIVYNFYGVAAEDIASGSIGYVVTGGELSGLDTSKFAYKDSYGMPQKFLVCLSTTVPGQITNNCLGRSLYASNSLYIGDPNIIDPVNGSILITALGRAGSSAKAQVKAGENLKKGDVVQFSVWDEVLSIGTAVKALGEQE